MSDSDPVGESKRESAVPELEKVVPDQAVKAKSSSTKMRSKKHKGNKEREKERHHSAKTSQGSEVKKTRVLGKGTFGVVEKIDGIAIKAIDRGFAYVHERAAYALMHGTPNMVEVYPEKSS